MKLIDKDILITEIERRLEAISSSSNENNRELAAIRGAQQFELINLILFINTLDVKEVDSELNSFDATVCKIGSTYLKEMDRDAIAKALEPYKDGDKVKVIIKAKGE